LNFRFTCSWTNGVGVQIVGKNEKLEIFRWLVRNESGKNEVEKFGPKLESTTGIGKFSINLERTIEVEKLLLKLEISEEIFQLRSKLSNFVQSFPT